MKETRRKRTGNALCALCDKAREQLHAYRHRYEIPEGTVTYWWAGSVGHITSGFLPRNYMAATIRQLGTPFLRVAKIREGENGYGPFVDYFLSPDGTCDDPSKCLIVNGPDAFLLTKVPEKMPEFTDSAVLSLMATGECDIMDGWRSLTTTTELMRTFFVNRHKARAMLKDLENRKLIQAETYGGQTEDGYAFCHRGWALTEKAKATPEYRRAAYREAKVDAECFSDGRPEMPGYYHAIVRRETGEGERNEIH